MMGGAGRSMGKRRLEATGPLPSRGRPSGSMTRPISPSPTGTSITRPVRSTSVPACRRSQSPRSMTPISSSSTLNAMPYSSPGNITSSSKPTLGRPETLAMPIETFVIVPTSRGVSCGVNAANVRLMPANAWSKSACRFSGKLFMSALGADHRRAIKRSVRSASYAWLAKGWQDRFARSHRALFQRREIIRDAPGHLLSVGGQFDAADQFRHGLELDVNISREGFVDRFLDRARAPTADRTRCVRKPAGSPS